MYCKLCTYIHTSNWIFFLFFFAQNSLNFIKNTHQAWQVEIEVNIFDLAYLFGVFKSSKENFDFLSLEYKFSRNLALRLLSISRIWIPRLNFYNCVRPPLLASTTDFGMYSPKPESPPVPQMTGHASRAFFLDICWGILLFKWDPKEFMTPFNQNRVDFRSSNF